MLTIISVSPAIGPQGGGTPVLIRGTDFQVGMTFTFGGDLATEVVVVNSTTAACVVPVHTPGAVSVVADTPDLQTFTLPAGYTYQNSNAVGYSFTTAVSPLAPVAIVAPGEQDTVVGAVVRLDGRASFSPTGLDLTYTWKFKQKPIGSQVEVDGFKDLETDSSAVSFAPDLTGLYVVELMVNDGSFDSLPATTEVNTKVVLVPHNRGIVPDASWVWNFLSDFWTRVEQRQRFETFWSAAIQVVAAEQLKLWQYDYNKSIKDIQDLIQKRWLAYEPQLVLDSTKTSFILAQDQAGLEASTFLIDPDSFAAMATQPVYNNIVTVPAAEGSFAAASYGGAITTGRLLQLGDQSFTLTRTGTATRSVNYGIDGSTVVAGNTFHGSALSVGMVGMRLKILSGLLKGTVYKILSVPDSATLMVQNLDGSPVVFASTTTNLSYSIFPAGAPWNVFFADQLTVPTQQFPVPWRFSPTLVSNEYDFETQGVAPGDVLVLQVTRTDNRLSSTINVQVVSVDRNRLGFVFNTDDLTDGQASTAISRDDQVKLSQDLQVAGLMVSLNDNQLVYTDEALKIQTLVKSPAFKRLNFEKSLSPTSVIDLGVFSVTVTPQKVLRNSKVLINSDIRSIPSLQEYVKEPYIVEQDGALFQIAEDKLYPIPRKPITAFENADYVLDNESGVKGTCTITNGSDLITVPFGDLLDRSIQQGDTIVIVDGVTEYTFDVIAIQDPETLRVSPPAVVSLGVAPFQISRRVEGNFIRFIKGTFTKKSPAPNRLWAEVTFFDNGQTIEENFGVLVSVLREDLSSVGATVSYKNAVAGLMYALTNGPTVANLELASQILLGLPFTTNEGTIIEIDPSFKTRLDGSPLLGRILVNAEDSKGKDIGITNIYFYPQGKQIPDPLNPGEWLPANPALSGLNTNPDTGEEYKVGDHVDLFAALSRGTQVQDYLTDSSLVQEALNQGNTGFAIQRYHSFRLTVNADVVTAVDTDLLAKFIKKAKPTYIKLAFALSKEVEDNVEVDDAILFKAPVFLQDNVSLSLPVAAALDRQSVDGSILTLEGDVLAYRLFGGDLVTVQGSYAINSAAGGFINARPGESHDVGFILPQMVVRINGGPNDGLYVIQSVDSDSQITLNTTDAEGAAFAFDDATAQSFVIYMPTFSPVDAGSGTVTNGANFVPMSGVGSLDVSVGDLLVFTDFGATNSRIYKITAVDVLNQRVVVTPSIQEATGTYQSFIFREGLINQHFGFAESDSPLQIVQAIGNSYVTLSAPLFIPIQLVSWPGDVIVNPTTSEEFTIIDFDPALNRAYVSPPPANNGTYPARLERQDRADTTVPLDILDRMPADSLFLTVKRQSGGGGSGPDLTTTAASATVSTVSGLDFDTGLGVMPGDYLVVLEGADSTRDIGYGAGIFPIYTVNTTNLILTRPLTATHAAPGILYGIQRRRRNER